MSVKLSAYVWDGCAASGMKITSVAIMARLADFSNDEGVCWPSIATIARQLGAGMSTIRTSLRKLEVEGWLTSSERRNGNRNASNLYQLNVKKLRDAAMSHSPDSGPSKSDTSKSDASESDPSKSDAPESITNDGFHPPESGDDPSLNSKHDPLNKNPSCPGASLPDENPDDFLSRYPEAVVYSAKKRLWGRSDDLKCAQWIWSRIVQLYEKAAESDGELSRPKEPNWPAWANDVRLMCSVDGRTHRQICALFMRVQSDSFWCRNILSPAKLREQWDELVIRLTPAQRSITDTPSVNYEIPNGFRSEP